MVRDARESESGQVVAFVVGILLVLFGFVALSLDVGFWFLDRRLAQNQADAAALAAVQELPSDDMTDTESVAHEYLERNDVDLTDICGIDVTDEDGDSLFDTVRVCIRRDAPLFFTSLPPFNLTSVKTGAVAVASVATGPEEFSLMALNPTLCAAMFFSQTANVDIVAPAGSTYTKSSCPTNAFQANGDESDRNVTIDDATHHHYVVGRALCAGSPTLDCLFPEPVDMQSGMLLSDPWAALNPPTPPNVPCPDDPWEVDDDLAPGTYACLVIVDNETVGLQSGEYRFQGGLRVINDAELTSNGQRVLLYVGGDGLLVRDSELRLRGRGSNDIALWVNAGGTDCDGFFPDPSSAGLLFLGDTDLAIDGNIYARASTVDFGLVGSRRRTLGAIIADRLCFRGRGELDVQQNVLVPDVPITRGLVE
jgi:Flp pilus assembly protein TadG